MENVDTNRLRSYVERIESVLSDIKDLQEDVKEIKIEAKSAGYEVKAIMALIKLRAMRPEDREYQETLLETYKTAIGL